MQAALDGVRIALRGPVQGCTYAPLRRPVGPAICTVHSPDRENFPLSMNTLRYLPFLVVLAIVLYSGLRPEPVPQVFDQQDKLHHMLGFAALMFTMRLAFPQWHLARTIVLSLAAATLIELGQEFLPNRQASLGDMVANTLGVLLGWATSTLMYRWYLRRIGVTTRAETQQQGERTADATRP